MKDTVSSFAVLFLLLVCSCTQKHDAMAGAKILLQMKMDSMQLHLVALQESVNTNEPQEQLARHFIHARRYFKEAEALNEFYFPVLCEFMNGPALDEADEYDDKVIEATGFQMIEEYIFPAYDPRTKAGLLQEIETLLNGKNRFDQLLEGSRLTDKNNFEAVRLELLRIVSLGVSGFDSPVAQHSIPEAKAALAGTEQVLRLYAPLLKDDGTWRVLHRRFLSTYAYLDANIDFNTFNRAEFMADHIKPLSGDIYKYQQALGIPNNGYLIAVDLTKPALFSGDDFNEGFFTPALNPKPENDMIALGKILFFDPILSGNNKRSCASCHNPANAFSENKIKSVAFDFAGAITRNAPTLINAGFQRSQFWDQRVHFMEDQVNDVVTNPAEMHGDPDRSLQVLMSSQEYRELFERAFGSETPFTPRHIREALAAYIRSLQGLHADFDLYLSGDKSRLNDEAIRGFNLFMGKGKCGTCHFAPLFNGTIPPAYAETEAEVLGVPQTADTVNAVVDDDPGKYNAYRRELFKNAFKTPTIRNAALTAPYMHNGVYATLEDVLDFYNRGGGAGIGAGLSNQTLPSDKLGLTHDEQKQIIAFIHALTDTTGLTSVPKKLPVFEDSKHNKRVIGGEY